MRRHGPMPTLGRTAIVLQILLALAVAAVLLSGTGLRLPFTDHGWTLHVAFADVGGLANGDRAPVTVAGVPSGRVAHVDYHDGRADLTLRLDGKVRGKLHAGARAIVQPRSALNDLTVDLSAGPPSAPDLHDGDRIQPGENAAPVTSDQVLGTLDADTRTSLQLLVGGLATGTKGPLADDLRKLAPAAASARTVAAQLRSRRTQLRQLVGDLDTLFTALGRRAGDLDDAIGAGTATLAAVADQDAALKQSIQALPTTLTQLDQALDQTTRLSGHLDPALSALRPVARSLPKALDALRSTAPELGNLLDQVDALARSGARPARDLRSTLTALGPAATGLREPVQHAQPVVDAIDSRKQGIGVLGDRFNGVFSTNDANGVILRGLGFFEAFNPANFGFPGATGAKLTAVKADVVTLLVQTCLKQNPVACLVRYLVPGLPGAVRKR